MTAFQRDETRVKSRMLGTAVSEPPSKIVLFERIHERAIAAFKGAGFTDVQALDFTPKDDLLVDLIADARIVGIRSRTKLTAEVLAHARNLACIGCFCIGTNQIDLQAAKALGVPVFNAPYSNTRSVAEMVIGEILVLMRGIPEKNAATHAGRWEKSVGDAQEVRGKVLGIVGYGHIGSQVSILAESIGFNVRYYDIADKLAMGNAQPCATLSLLLAVSDVVSLHVPSTPMTRNMIGTRELNLMKPGSILINAARGDVVDIDALAAALQSGHVRGAAVDVFPVEPAGGDEPFDSPLQGMPNVILTPHIGGSTLEAQEHIGRDVSDKLIKYLKGGSTDGAVNFVELSLPTHGKAFRFAHIHKNEPGVLSHINSILSERQLNIAGQYLRTDADMGYAVSDVNCSSEDALAIVEALQRIPGTVQARLLG